PWPEHRGARPPIVACGSTLMRNTRKGNGEPLHKPFNTCRLVGTTTMSGPKSIPSIGTWTRVGPATATNWPHPAITTRGAETTVAEVVPPAIIAAPICTGLTGGAPLDTWKSTGVVWSATTVTPPTKVVGKSVVSVAPL